MNVGVIGSGIMGSGIVQILAETKGINSVIWLGSCGTRLDNSYSKLQSNWLRATKKGRLSIDEPQLFASKIKTTIKYEKFTDCQFVIEAVSEDYVTKEAIFSNLSKVINDECILASNTSSLSITALASKVPFPQRVIGLHFFNPANIMKLTEVVIGLNTCNTTIEKTISLAKMLHKTPVKVNEAPGFIVNRMLIPMINEGVGILAEGVATAQEIDNAMKYGANHPIGPLALSDLIGNDVVLAIMESLYTETGDPKYRANPLLRKLVRGNKFGRKSGEGFYKYK